MPKLLYVICEGDSEQEFVKQILTPYIGMKTSWAYSICPYKVVTSRDRQHGKIYRGGVVSFDKVKNDILSCMKTGNPVTTMIDLYAIPNDFPEYDKSLNVEGGYQKAQVLENGLKNYMCRQLPNYKSEMFLPYLQVYEFEALFYTDLEKLKSFYLENVHSIDVLNQSVKGIAPEDIDNGSETAPSKRLINALPYKKGMAVIEPLKRIGIDDMIKACPHFGKWIDNIMNLVDNEND